MSCESAEHTADVQVLVRRGLGQLAVVLVPKVFLVFVVVLLDAVDPDGGDTDCMDRSTWFNSASVFRLLTAGESDVVAAQRK